MRNRHTLTSSVRYGTKGAVLAISLQRSEQFHEFLPDVSEDTAPVLERSVEVVGNRLQAVERKASLLAEEGGGIGLHVKEVVLLGKGLHLLRREGLCAHEVIAGEHCGLR